MPSISQTLYVTSRGEWRQWLQTHYASAPEIWLVYPRRATGKPRIVYNDAVEEALCFGWIDSTVKTLDKDATVQRFSPRNPRSSYSQQNIERLRRLQAAGTLRPEIAESTQDILAKGFIFPDDILAAIRAHPRAWEHYQTFSPSYQRIRVAFIEGARKRPAEFKKRLDYFIAMCEKNKLFGFGGIEAYY